MAAPEVQPEELVAVVVVAQLEADRDGRAPDPDLKPCRSASVTKDLKDNPISLSGTLFSIPFLLHQTFPIE